LGKEAGFFIQLQFTALALTNRSLPNKIRIHLFKPMQNDMWSPSPLSATESATYVLQPLTL